MIISWFVCFRYTIPIISHRRKEETDEDQEKGKLLQEDEDELDGPTLPVTKYFLFSDNTESIGLLTN